MASRGFWPDEPFRCRAGAQRDALERPAIADSHAILRAPSAGVEE
jgi:hypothetical protein